MEEAKEMNDKYPVLEINLDGIRQNTAVLSALLDRNGISLTGVVKVFHGLDRAARAMEEGGCRHLSSSRLEQLRHMKSRGVACPLMLLRIPMLSEVEELVHVADISLNSERQTVEALAAASTAANLRHGVVLMQDLGDLREGFFDEDELIDLALHIEINLKSLELKGIGTNLGCYGAIRPTVENLSALVKTAKKIETLIGRRLEIVSGGATSSLPLLLDGKMPKGITNLRIGEGLLVNRDLPDIWNVSVPGLRKDTFALKAQVVEVKDKPSHPVGEVFIDAFGNRPVYKDRGIRRRAILAVGRQDICDPEKLVPMVPGVEIVGASSDHLIVDVQNCQKPVVVGDVLTFGMFYSPLLFLSGSASVEKSYIDAYNGEVEALV